MGQKDREGENALVLHVACYEWYRVCAPWQTWMKAIKSWYASIISFHFIYLFTRTTHMCVTCSTVMNCSLPRCCVRDSPLCASSGFSVWCTQRLMASVTLPLLHPDTVCVCNLKPYYIRVHVLAWTFRRGCWAGVDNTGGWEVTQHIKIKDTPPTIYLAIFYSSNV